MIQLPQRLELLTDLYELTMAASYFDNELFSPATFSLFIRKYPQDRAYFVAVGQEDVLDLLAQFQFSEDDLAFLDQTGIFSDEFLQFLKDLRFTGNVRAIPEGRIFFANEPILEISAPIIEAQIMETIVINTIHLQTMVASKAARCFHAADGRPLVDFSLRRTHGIDAGLKVARSSYIAGFTGTSNVLAGKLYGIPIFGTMAHSFISSFSDEVEAFRAFARTFPKKTLLLIDTYDTIKGAYNAITVAREMAQRGENLLGVRLDSGDLSHLSKEVRKILDESGLEDVQIFASSGLDEFEITEIIKGNGMIDAFGVGTKLGVSADAPYLDIVYKIVQYNGRPVKKLSSGKVTLAGEKQVFRKTGDDGMFIEDIVGVWGEEINDRKPLLKLVMQGGKRLEKRAPIDAIRQRFLNDFSALAPRYKRLKSPDLFPVRLSDRLQALQKDRFE